MGQSSSRQHKDSNADASSSSPDSTATTNDAAHDSEPTIVTRPPRSRRESVRKSILNLVKPSARLDNPPTHSRKSWRNSRRWSKAPQEPPPPATPSQPPETSSAPPLPALIASKGKEVEQDNSVHPTEDPAESSSRPSTADHSPNTTPEVTHNTSVDPDPTENQGSSVAATHTSEPPLSTEDQDQVVISPDSPLISTPPTIVEHQPEPLPEVHAAADEPSPVPPVPPPQLPVHQFPPPGTLVVVQGVVHTTDVPRTPAPFTTPLEVPAPTPRSSSTPPTTRNRLSSLLHSHSSTSGSRPASTIGTITPTNNHTSTTLDATPNADGTPVDSAPLHVDSRATLSDSVPSNLSNSTGLNPSPLVQPPSTTDSTPGTISSGSIDVLGTLLSVAAAATAASLLTGTSEPLLLPPTLTSPSYTAPTSLSPSSNNGNSNTTSPSSPPLTSPDTPNSRPTSPTPTAGLGFDTTRAERLRQAWGSIRERLGLRPSPSLLNHSMPNSPDNDPMNIGSAPPGMLPTSNDPREHLFGQMARAFNLGLGLSGDSTPGPGSLPMSGGRSTEGAQNTDSSGADARLGQLPAEGSFERFLVDLQTDLRVALTSANNLPVNQTTSSNTEATTEQAPPVGSNPVTAEQRSEESDIATSMSEDDMPALDDVSDSDSEFDDTPESSSEMEGESVTVSGAFSLDNSPSRQRAQNNNEDAGAAAVITGPGESQTSMPEIDSQGRINWWRLYRFPPIALPPMQGIPAVPTSSSNTPTTFPSPPPPPPSTAMDSTLSELPFANEPQNPRAQGQEASQPNIYSVVPVIVVGVQSVNAHWQLRPPAEEDMDGFMEDTVPTAHDTPIDAEDTRTRGGRGRGWPSRAAEALRNLRPTRRNRNALPTVGPGSRTFLIYVIGGYYPPNHIILNGGPDTLASLEALLELADLLGHAKPPTATKEDIQKSGLEIIKSTQLEQYEREEKISSNCTERCLICLDEYQPEDNIRLMTCRHAFHQTCVDKWLETGRNNCPACRSKGVSVDGIPDL